MEPLHPRAERVHLLAPPLNPNRHICGRPGSLATDKPAEVNCRKCKTTLHYRSLMSMDKIHLLLPKGLACRLRPPNPLTTKEISKVTCGNCRKTRHVSNPEKTEKVLGIHYNHDGRIACGKRTPGQQTSSPKHVTCAGCLSSVLFRRHWPSLSRPRQTSDTFISSAPTP